MSRNASLGAMKTRVRQLADVIGDVNVTEAMLNSLVNAHVAAVYDRLVDAGPPDRYAATTTISVLSGIDTYALPADFRNLLGVYVSINGGLRSLAAMSGGARALYRASSTTASVMVEYVPTPPALVVDGDTFDGVSGWEDLVIALAARDVMVSRQDEPSVVLAIISANEQRISLRSAGRDRGSPKRVTNLDKDRAVENWGWGARTGRLECYRLLGDNLQIFEPSMVGP